MKILIIDTSTEKPLIAFSSNENLLLNIPLPEGQQSSRFAANAISSGLESLRIKIEEIDACAVTIGPGSFTGIRVGASLAKGIAFPKKIPLIGLSSLSGFISSVEGKFASIIDARIGGVYLLFQENCQGKIRELSMPKFVRLEDLKDNPLDCLLVGPAFNRLPFEGEEKYPDASHLARLAFEKINKGEGKGDLQLVYLNSNYSERHPKFLHGPIDRR